MTELKDIIKFLDKYLRNKEIKDTSRNGLQVKGRLEVSKIAFAENASLDTFKMALKEKADLIVVHHGILWKTRYKKYPVFERITKERMRFLTKNEISLYASHLPLDRHKTIGNNSQLLKLLGAKIRAKFAMSGKKSIGWIGEFKSPAPVSKIIKILNKKLKTECEVLLFGPKKIKTIAVCSGGGGSSVFYEALSKKVDLYLTGEISEVYTSAKDAKLNVIFAGHYATETVGVKALMKVVKKKFKIKTVFIDDPTGL